MRGRIRPAFCKSAEYRPRGQDLLRDDPQVNMRDLDDPQTLASISVFTWNKRERKREEKRWFTHKCSPTANEALLTEIWRSMILLDSHVSSISKSGASLSHRKKSPNSHSTKDEDPAPTMCSSSTVTACMSQVKKVQTWFVVDLYFFGSNTLSL